MRERLVDGARRRYQTGLRRSLIALRSQRYFRLLDALDALVSERAHATSGEESAPVTIDAAYRRVRKAAKPQRPPATRRATTTATRHCT